MPHPRVVACRRRQCIRPVGGCRAETPASPPPAVEWRRSRRTQMRCPILLAAVVGMLAAGTARGQEPAAMRIQAPELRDVTDWVNTPPLKLADWRGQVVV